MTVDEFSDEFDTLVSSYRRFKAFDDREILDSIEFNEYEKSVFLTLAQDLLVKDLYTDKSTPYSFESTEEVRKYLEQIVKHIDYNNQLSGQVLKDNKYNHFIYAIPDDCWFIIYELALLSGDNLCVDGTIVDVLPVTHDMYLRIRRNPFRGPNNRRVLRLDKGAKLIEIISSNNIGTYTIRYISKPEPIVLAHLENESIDNVKEPQTCKLPTSIHRHILERAVLLGMVSKVNTNNNNKDSKD